MNTWRPTNDPPVMDQEVYGWPTSLPVLGIDRLGNMLVVTQEQVDPDGTCEWYTNDSERYTVTEDLCYWMPLPPPPMGGIADAREKQQ